jgi:hypothetical protein
MARNVLMRKCILAETPCGKHDGIEHDHEYRHATRRSYDLSGKVAQVFQKRTKLAQNGLPSA